MKNNPTKPIFLRPNLSIITPPIIEKNTAGRATANISILAVAWFISYTFIIAAIRGGIDCIEIKNAKDAKEPTSSFTHRLATRNE